jgi:hypothetical protein
MKKSLFVLVAWAWLQTPDVADAQTTAQAESFVRHIYSEYTTPPKHNSPDFLDRDMALAFSPSLMRVIRTELHKTPKGEVGKIDSDPICDCQDWENLLIAKLDVTKTDDTTAIADVAVKNMDATRPVKLMLVWMPQGWRIDDISMPDTPSYRKYLLTPEVP